MDLKINYLEDDDEVPKRERPNVQPRAHPPPPIPRPPVPSGPSGQAWYVCGTETCSHYGYCATGRHPDELVKRVKRGRCRVCKGLGIEVEADGSVCEHCRGRGQVVLREWEEPPEVKCPYCQRQMVFVREGPQPTEYPRMETPHSDEPGDFRGQVSFGRRRTVSLE